MIHYTCDRCKREFNSRQEMRYEVLLEVRQAVQPEIEFSDEDSDHLLELHEILGQINEHTPPQCAMVQQHFDLCPHCYKRFIADPLGRDSNLALGFSYN
ncbi:hypothetical protein [Roseimaritima sediminicola]|uniref:hypothetical protein n=1 Tax=Roseimaritima sediminicola TaxID=2662066 RepID=UPI001F259975|nr:hypothetical protein [Roseimaritima sediminicola]